MALSNADKVKLLLNGKVISEQVVDPYEMNTWSVPYKPGKLEAIGYKNGKIVSRTKVETTKDPVQVRLTPDRNSLAGEWPRRYADNRGGCRLQRSSRTDSQ